MMYHFKSLLDIQLWLSIICGIRERERERESLINKDKCVQQNKRIDSKTDDKGHVSHKRSHLVKTKHDIYCNIRQQRKQLGIIDLLGRVKSEPKLTTRSPKSSFTTYGRRDT